MVSRVEETAREVRRLDREARGGKRVGTGRARRFVDRRKKAAKDACRLRSSKSWD
jgi:hypothetical protein